MGRHLHGWVTQAIHSHYPPEIPPAASWWLEPACQQDREVFRARLHAELGRILVSRWARMLPDRHVNIIGAKAERALWHTRPRH